MATGRGIRQRVPIAKRFTDSQNEGLRTKDAERGRGASSLPGNSAPVRLTRRFCNAQFKAWIVDASLLTVSETNGITILTLKVRDLVEHTVHPLRLEIQKLLPTGPARWVLDLPMTEFVASAGIGLVVQIAQRIGSLGGKLALCTSRKELRELFSAPYFVRTVSIFDNLPAAISSVSQQ